MKSSKEIIKNSRRTFIQGALATGVVSAVGVKAAGASMTQRNSQQNGLTLTQQWDKTFPQDPNVGHRKVSFKTRYGIYLAGDLYWPKHQTDTKLPALAVSGPFGAVKEQSAGLYAQTLASRGFVTLAFDPSFTGESGGTVRNTASPDISSEDFSAAVDYLGTLNNVSRERIGVMAICGLSGMAITAASADSRIKAVATASMYDMSRSMSRAYKDAYTLEQRHEVIDYLSQQRWKDIVQGTPAVGLHEVPFDAQGHIVTGNRILPETLPANADPVTTSFFNYYRTKRGFHPRSVISTSAWQAAMPMSFFRFPLMENIKLVSPRPLMLVAGENAHSLYYSQDVYRAAADPRQLVIIPNADHVDLYDNQQKIPFDRLATFFKENLA